MKKTMASLLIASLGLLSAGTALADQVASTSDFNILKFGQPITKVVLPPNAPIAGSPVYMSDNKILLLRFDEDKNKPVQIVVQMEDGSTRSIRLIPTKGIPGQTYDFGGGSTVAVGTLGNNPNARFVPDLSSVMSDKRPEGYIKADSLPPVMMYDRVSATPEESIVNPDKHTRITRYRIDALHGLTSDLDAAQFYAPGVNATLLDGTTVTPTSSLHLYLVTEEKDGGDQ